MNDLIEVKMLCNVMYKNSTEIYRGEANIMINRNYITMVLPTTAMVELDGVATRIETTSLAIVGDIKNPVIINCKYDDFKKKLIG